MQYSNLFCCIKKTIPVSKHIKSKTLLRVIVSHHVLHTDADLPVAVKGPIEAHDVGGVAFMQHLQLSNNLVPDGWLDFQVDQLNGVKRMKP